MKINDLCAELRQPGARLGVGAWLMPREYLGNEAAAAVRLNLQALDLRLAYLERLPEGARFSGLTRPNGHQNLFVALRELAGRTHNRDCLLVHTLDLLLLGLEVDERERFWHTALTGIPYPRTRLILSVPERAAELFPLDLQRLYTAQIAEGAID